MTETKNNFPSLAQPHVHKLPYPKYMDQIHTRIVLIRNARGFSSAQMAEMVNIPHDRYKRIERNETHLKLDEFILFCIRCEIDFSMLLDPDLPLVATEIVQPEIEEIRR